MSYMDGFVLQLPVEKLPAYRRMTRKCGKKWMEHHAHRDRVNKMLMKADHLQ
jgi:uncharacterized protein YbaA (DUF1428 family)